MQLDLFSNQSSPQTMNENKDRESWRLRDLALSELVPIRIRNVVADQPADHPMLQLDLPEALRRWSEVEAYLLDCRNMGEGSCRQLRAALQSLVSECPVQQGKCNIENRSGGIQTFGEFLSSKLAPVRIRNLVRKEGIATEFIRLTPKQAIERWPEIEGYFSTRSAIGSLSCQRLRQSLEGIVDSEPSSDQFQLTKYIGSHASGVVDSVKQAFADLDSSHPLHSLSVGDAKTYLPILRYRLLIHPSIGQSKINQFEEQMLALAEKAGKSPDERAAQELLHSVLSENPLAFQPASVALEIFGGEDSRADAIAEAGDCTVVDLIHKKDQFLETRKPWFRDLVATFLFESREWLDDTNGPDQLCLSDQGLLHLKKWSQTGDVNLGSEWVCIHFVSRLLGVARSTQILAHFSDRPSQQDLVRRMLSGRAVHRESIRKKLAQKSVIVELLDQIGNASLADQDIKLSTGELFELLLRGTNDRHREIVLARFAQESGPSLTLEEVGQLFNVTRERIRQITQKWLQRIENDGRSEIAAKHVEKMGSDWISLLSTIIEESPEHVTIEELANDFPRQEKLILAACNQTPKQWLVRNSQIVDGEILLIHVDDGRIREAEEFLNRFLLTNPELPRLTSRIPQAPDHLAQTVFSTDAVKSGRVSAIVTPAGVVLAENRSASTKRLAFVMSVFEEHPDWILSDQQLWNAICKLSDERSARGQWRIFENSLRSEPSRFRKISRIGWMDLMDCSLSKDYRPERGPLLTPCLDMGSRAEAMGDENQRGRLYSLIAENGGLYAKECIELWAKHDETGTGTSAGFLLSDPFFVICHPGMTGCLDDHGELVNLQRIRERLRSLEALQTYVRFRQGGFGPLDFPAWDSLTLETWQELANESIREDVAEKINAQLQFDLKIAAEIRETNSAKRDVVFDIGYLNSPRRPADSMLPSLEEVFLLAAVATRFGFLNYYLVNCCTGRHWYSHRSISWMAFLISSGIIEGVDHWQKMHRVTERGRELLFKLVEPAMEFEELNWSTVPIGQEILEFTADNWREYSRDSWVVHSEFARLLVGLMDPIRRNGNKLLNPEVFHLSSSKKSFPQKEDVSTSAFVDPFLDELLG